MHRFFETRCSVT